MSSKRIKSVYLSNIILFLLVLVSYTNCGTALTFQAEEEAAKQQNDSSSNSILAALGLSAGGGSSGIIGFSKSSMSFDTATGSGTYTITVPSWPTTGLGSIGLALIWSGSMACSNPSPSNFSFADDDQYPVTSPTITFSCLKPGSGTIDHLVISAPASASSMIGQSFGVVNVTVTP